MLFSCQIFAENDPLARPDRIVVVKHQHNLFLMAGKSVLRTYAVALGADPSGPKHFEGDHRTPEGVYFVAEKRLHSRFHKALLVSYPNARDVEYAQAARRKPGGEIMIHGIRGDWAWIGFLHQYLDWTDGCIAVTDNQIDEIWDLVDVGTKIIIYK